jgi:nitroreductase
VSSVKEALQVIKNRRSIRKFKAEQIPYPDLQEILDCALYAPSAMNQQKWHFTVVQDKDTVNRMVFLIKENILKSGNEGFIKRANTPGYNTFYGAPTVIMISAEDKTPFAQFDCGAAAQNITLAATAQNIGSCVIGSSAFLFAADKNNALKKEFGIPEGYVHVCTVALGYREGEAPEAPPRKKDVVTYMR